LIGYCRVSTDDQAETGHSLGQQRERMQAYCALHGHRLVDTIVDEGVSASIPLHKRSGGAALVAAIRAGQGSGVVVVRLDRLFRNALDGLRFFEDVADRHAAAVHSVSELIDTGTPAGRLALTIQLAAAQYERDLAAQRASECNTALRERGRVYGGVPYGCKRVGDDLVRDPLTWPIRESIVQLREELGHTLREVAAHMRAEGVPSPSGARGWSPNTISRICKTHRDLTHLAMGSHDAIPHPKTPDTEASYVRNDRVH
nr:recombinase family protein [Dokdonella sp.]